MDLSIELTDEQEEQLQEIADRDSGGPNTSIEYFIYCVIKDIIANGQ